MPYVRPLGNYFRVAAESSVEGLQAFDPVPGDRVLLPGQEDVGDGTGRQVFEECPGGVGVETPQMDGAEAELMGQEVRILEG